MKLIPPLLVLAGGFGTRLRTVVADVPKALAPVAGRPYLHHLVAQWVADGVTEFVFLLHYEARMIENFLAQEAADGTLRNCTVAAVVEPRPLGTGGAIAHAVRARQIRGTFLVANADTWLGAALPVVGAQTGPALGVVHVSDAGRYGSVRLEGDRVFAFEEKSAERGAGWINAGLYHFPAEVFTDWAGQPFSLERETLPKLVAARALRAVRLETEFIDIGVPADYHRFCRWIEDAKSAPL